MEHNYFPQRPTVTPTIYAYRLIGVDSHKGYLKVGYTDRTAKERIDEQLHTSKVQYEIVLVESAMSNDGSCFTDKDVHRLLVRIKAAFCSILAILGCHHCIATE